MPEAAAAAAVVVVVVGMVEQQYTAGRSNFDCLALILNNYSTP
jgi:hypothetical protein